MEQLNTTSGLVVALLLFFAGIVVVRLSHNSENMGEQLRLFVVAYMARMAMILAVYNFGLISILGDMDSSGWVNSLVFYERWQQEGYGPLTAPFAVLEELLALQNETKRSTHVLHVIAYASLFLTTGLPGRITAASLNALFGALIPVLSYRMSYQVFKDVRAARYLGWVLALMPSLLTFSALTAKEPFVVFFEVLALYCCVQIAQRRFRLRYLLAFCFSAYCMQFLRFYVFYVFLGTIAAALVVPVFIRGSFRKLAIATGVLVFPLVIYVGYNAAMAERNEESSRRKAVFGQFGSTAGLKSYSGTMGGGSFVENPFDITQPAEFVPGMLFGLVHLLYAPFPWNLARGSNLMLLTLPEVLWWYYVGTIRLTRGLRYGIRTNLADALIPILFCLPLLYYYSLIFSNIGLAYRYRAQIYPELILFIGFGYKRRKNLHGYESYALPETDDADEFEPQQMLHTQRQPWVAHDRFYNSQGFRPNQRQDRNSRFDRM